MSVSIPSSMIALWSICELVFYSSEAHKWNDFPLQVTFENGDTQLTLDAYWDGDNVWKVRFAPTKTGTWKWKASSTDSLDWREGLKLPGSGHLKHVADFFNSIEWWKLMPCREWLRVDGNPLPMPTEDDITPPRCAAERGRIYVIYILQGNRDKKISVTHLDGKAYKARWYNPRNGVYSDINGGKPVNMDQKDEWTLPSVPDDEDWVVKLTK